MLNCPARTYHDLDALPWLSLIQVYSSVRKFRDDLGVFPPDHLVCVPLVLDTLRSRVRAFI